MKSIKNHISLVLALTSILFAIQTLIVTHRALEAYEKNLKTNYSIVVVSDKVLNEKTLKSKSSLIESVEDIEVDDAIKRIDSSISKNNLELLKLSLPEFYKLTLSKYPTPSEIKQLKKQLKTLSGVKKIEDFKTSYDTSYKLLTLFGTVVTVFSVVVFVITSLLILKELRIWQYIHKDRMNIMGLFGAPKWLSSAVLFRLAIIDAVISSFLVFIAYAFIKNSDWLGEKLSTVGIDIEIFDFVNDFPILFVAAVLLSILLATAIAFSHKEEV